MDRSALVSTEWLQAHLDDPTVRVIEVVAWPESHDYEDGHIPGALRWFWKAALWHDTDREFPTPEEMADRLGRAGIRDTDTIVLYGDLIQFATYAFWVLTMTGHPDVRLLEGSRRKWVAEVRALDVDVPSVAPVTYRAQAEDQSSRVGRDDVREHLGNPGRVLLDVRSPEEYAGERVGMSATGDHGAERYGRIPGAVHLFFRELLTDDDQFKSEGELRSILASRGVVADSERETVVYCRLSHRATLAWFVMRYVLGLDDVRVYDGSWTEWGSIVGFPIER
ncbi:MAG: sulfurtransferase [Chloroflexi bacterium]|nr:sulfurtransferase [Chloroflexota bacterium]MDA1147075.1 sulfurtransferase [Chloroflexota bacterium]